MLTVEDALVKLSELITPISQSEIIPLKSSRDRVLAKPIPAPIDLPPFNSSAMDGYACRSIDVLDEVPTKLRVIDTSFAGSPSNKLVGKCEAVRIFTGAAMPRGSDTVVLQEVIKKTGDEVCFQSEAPPGNNVRHRGHDIQKGTNLAVRGDQLGAYRLSWLAAVGITEVEVLKKVRISVFSTGDELVEPGKKLKLGQIYDSNRVALIGLLEDKPVDVKDLGKLPDNPKAIEKALMEAQKESDLVITSGGVSVGDADFVKSVIESIGELTFWKLALKPGKPMAVGKLDHAIFFGLPGNPISTIITYLLFVAPAIDLFSGQKMRPPLQITARLQTEISHNTGRREYQRGKLIQGNDTLVVTPTGDQSSNRLATFAEANCLIIVPETQGNILCGELVNVILLPEQRLHPMAYSNT